MKNITILLLAAWTLCLCGCNSSNSSPANVVKNFHDLCKRGQVEKAVETSIDPEILAEPGAKEKLVAMMQALLEEGKGIKSYEIKEVKQSGERATISFSLNYGNGKTQTDTASVIQKNGRWYMDLTSTSTSGGEQQSREVARLQSEIVQLRAENQLLKTFQLLTNEVARLQKDNAEIFRLRNEVRQLRLEKVQYDKFIAESQQREQWQSHRSDPLQANACINNLRQMDGATDQWAIENRKQTGAVVRPGDISDYIKGGFPKCPAGGHYTVTRVGDNPTCSIPGHALPNQ